MPAGKGAAPGSGPARDLLRRAVPAVLSAIRLGHDCYRAVTAKSANAGRSSTGTAPRPQVQFPSSFAHARTAGSVTRIGPAVITMADTRLEQHNIAPVTGPRRLWNRRSHPPHAPSRMPPGRKSS